MSEDDDWWWWLCYYYYYDDDDDDDYITLVNYSHLEKRLSCCNQYSGKYITRDNGSKVSVVLIKKQNTLLV